MNGGVRLIYLKSRSINKLKPYTGYLKFPLLCVVPGSKTLQALDTILANSAVKDHFVLVANEVDHKKATQVRPPSYPPCPSLWHRPPPGGGLDPYPPQR
jgi:hypothetical protein